MKNIKKSKIIIFIILIIFTIIALRAFTKSRANKTIEINVDVIDNSKALTDETTILTAVNEGENGIAITLPEIINTKKVSKYIVTRQEIIQEETNESPTNTNITENSINENKSNESIIIEKLPNEKIYLTQEEIESLQMTLTVEYDYIESNSQALYNRKLVINDEENNEILSVLGYMPIDTQIELNEANIEDLKNDIEEKYPNRSIIKNYDIKLILNEKEYIPKEYEQTVEIEFLNIDENTNPIVLELQNNNITETNEISITDGKINIVREQLNSYIILQENYINLYATEEPNEEELITNNNVENYIVNGENTTLNIDDYESDKNYYLGLNYTEENSKKYTGKYTENNLKDVVINYYGYDYNLTEFTIPEEYDVTLNATAQRSQTGTISQTGSGGNRYYKRTDTIRVTVTGINTLKDRYPNFNADSNWTMQIEVPNTNFSNYFYEDGTNSQNESDGITASISNNILIVNGNDCTALENNSDTWTFTFKVNFRSNNRNNVNNTTFRTLTVNSFETTITVGEYTPYGTISDTETQTLVSYRKCIPVNSDGKITIDLIDNPFMNRPQEMGFNGWITNDNRYSGNIETNPNTYVQTLKTNISNITNNSGNYEINLYADWIKANVIFVSSSGSSSNSGTSPSSPVNNAWNSINSKINANIKTCTNASNREVNIVVLMNGTLDASGLTGPGTPYTLTSLYNGTNYGSTSTYLNVGSTNVQLDSDLQIDYIYVSTNSSYSSPYVTTDGTAALSPCIYGNMYNLRIGRGVVSTNSNNCTWAQIQGGYYNHSSNEYKLVIETGKYLTVQLYRAANSSQATTANATVVMGNDIDRNEKNNENLKIYNRMASRTTSATCNPYTGSNSKAIVINMIIKSGTFGIDFFNRESTDDDSDRNYAGIYVGGHGNTGYDKSDRYLLVEGGNIANIIGGLNVSEADMYKTYMYVKDGNVLNITGGAGYTHTYGDRIIQVTGGYVKYSISGGSNGVAASSSSNNGQLTGESLIYIGGTAEIGASSTIDTNGNEIVTITDTSEVLYGVNAGSVCGGANGNSRYAGQTDGSYIIIDGEAIVHNNVFGGGNYGIIGSSNIQQPGIITFFNETSNFTTNKEYLITTSNYGENGLSKNNNSLSNESMSTQSIPSDSSKWIFESSGNQYYIKNALTGQYIYIENVIEDGFWWFYTYTAEVTLSSSNRTAFTLQGSNTKTITYEHNGSGGNKTLYLGYNNGTWEISSDTNNYNLYLLTYELNSTGETPDLETLVNIKLLGGTVENNIYGGANQNNIYGTVEIDIENGKVNGVVYGGSNIRGTISGSVLLDIEGGQLGEKSDIQGFDYSNNDVAFGGGLGEETSVNGRILLNVNETKNNTDIYGNVYGGSSLGKINSNVYINVQDLATTVNKLSISGYVFGGGKGEENKSAVVTGNVTINIDGSNLDNCSIFGGSNINGDVNGIITINVGKTYETILHAVYGGGNQASIGTETQGIYVFLLDNADIQNAFTGGKSADLISIDENDITRGIYLQGGTVENIYGGSDLSGFVTVTHVYIEYGKVSNVYGGNNQGGTANVTNVIMNNGTAGNVYGGNNQGGTANTTNVLIKGGNPENVYGGNNQGGIAQNTNVFVESGNIQTLYGGGDNAESNMSNVKTTGGIINNLYGGGNQAKITTNTNVNIETTTIQENIYGGGNEGTVEGNTNVHIKDSTINGSVYSGGNGSNATVYGNTNLIMEGTNNVLKSVFGGGNQAKTGTEEKNNSISTVNIVGATVGENVYGGANTSVVYGATIINLGYETVKDTSLQKGNIEIMGTVFGGGEANASGSEIYDFSFISVTKQINIEIDGAGHDEFSIKGSIFGSGNASSTSGTSNINIKNYGTPDDPQSNVSIQRTDCATISNSAISLSGATDRTNEYSTVFYSLSRVTQVKLKNNSTLYLCNGANLLEKLDSLVDINGKEEYAVVTIDADTGEVSERNVDNRIYMLEGKNLNVATNEQATAYGQVHGMFFFGLFTNRINPSTSTGFYHHSYQNGDQITNAGTFSSNSYAMAQHMLEHNTSIDGFYTNYKEDENIKVQYIETTPKDDVYYIWLVGEILDVTKFNVSLAASKYATLGTYELLLQGFSDPNLKFSINGFSAGLAEGISLVDPDEINTIEPDDDIANSVYGLTMKTGNNGWESKGTTKFLTQNGGTYTGTTNYNKDNSSYTPTINLCFYHSANITKKQALGDVRIRLQVLTPIDDLNYKISYIDIEITLSSALYQDDYYEAAITPGQEYGLFTTTETTITSNSAFSTYYSLYIEDFSNTKYMADYMTYNRVLISTDSNDEPYVFPVNTKITMLDMVTNKYYYYIVTNNDVVNNKYIYRLSDFIEMGSSDSLFDETEAANTYYNIDKNLIYENYIFHINFADSEITNDIQDNSLLMELRDDEDETLIGVLGIQRDSIKYSVYEGKNATIELLGSIDPETLYLGNTLNLDVNTKFTQVIVDSKTVYDTQYFDQKLGLKISIYDNNNNQLSLDSLFGVNFEIDGRLYYPRVDGTTRMSIADKVTDVLAKIKMNTNGNTTLATGDYKIKIESFGSPDGIYYGLVASDMIELNVRIINSAYGLKVVNNDYSKIIDKTTGTNEDGTNSLICSVEYSSKLANPNITISLYRRNYSDVFEQSYELVDLQDYLNDTLPTTSNEKEYLISDSPKEIITSYYALKPNLVTGTYKLVYKLYDGTTYVGEAFDYIVIK